MAVAVKFCGLTRSEDMRHAVQCGAAYVGIIFAGGPRSLTDDQATLLLSSCPPGPSRVGVMSDSSLSAMSDRATRLQLDIIQVHSDPSPEQLSTLRSVWGGGVWSVVRGTDLGSPALISELAEVADAVVIDSGDKGGLGGTGVPLPWQTLHIPHLGDCLLILAGGLTPQNVAGAIDVIHPVAVDVSSGVERLPGIKDWTKMDAFMAAVRHADGE